MKYRVPSAEVDFYSMMSNKQTVAQTLRGINKLNEVILGIVPRRTRVDYGLIPSEIGAREVNRPDPVLMFKVLIYRNIMN